MWMQTKSFFHKQFSNWNSGSFFLSFSIYLEIWPKMEACQENDRNPKHTSLSFISKHYLSKAYPKNWFQQHKTLVGDKWAATCISQYFKSIFWYHVYQCSIQIAKMSVSFNVVTTWGVVNGSVNFFLFFKDKKW